MYFDALVDKTVFFLFESKNARLGSIRSLTATASLDSLTKKRRKTVVKCTSLLLHKIVGVNHALLGVILVESIICTTTTVLAQ